MQKRNPGAFGKMPARAKALAAIAAGALYMHEKLGMIGWAAYSLAYGLVGDHWRFAPPALALAVFSLACRARAGKRGKGAEPSGGPVDFSWLSRLYVYEATVAMSFGYLQRSSNAGIIGECASSLIGLAGLGESAHLAVVVSLWAACAAPLWLNGAIAWVLGGEGGYGERGTGHSGERREKWRASPDMELCVDEDDDIISMWNEPAKLPARRIPPAQKRFPAPLAMPRAAPLQIPSIGSGNCGPSPPEGAAEDRIGHLLREYGVMVKVFETRETAAGRSHAAFPLGPLRLERLERLAKKDLPAMLGVERVEVRSQNGNVYIDEIIRGIGPRGIPPLGGDPLDFALGMDDSSRVLFANARRMQHMLVMGTTGSGKSSLVALGLLSLCRSNSPEEIGIMIVDPTASSYTAIQELPHLMCGILSAPGEINDGVQWMNAQMECRQSEAKNGFKGGMRTLILVADEIDDICCGCRGVPRSVKDSLARLARMSRASSIHLILSGQVPTVNTLGSELSNNLPSRVCGKIPATATARTLGFPDAGALAGADAEKLAGGEFQCRLEGSQSHGNGIERFRAYFATEGEVEREVLEIKEKYSSAASRPGADSQRLGRAHGESGGILTQYEPEFDGDERIEAEVLRLKSLGKSYRGIASELSLSLGKVQRILKRAQMDGTLA
jgi:hypothetical protein